MLFILTYLTLLNILYFNGTYTNGSYTNGSYTNGSYTKVFSMNLQYKVLYIKPGSTHNLLTTRL